MSNDTTKAILDYAELHYEFSIGDLFADLQDKIGISKPSLTWYLFKLVQDNSLVRTGRGKYNKVMKQSFSLSPIDEVKEIYGLLHENFPLLKFCIYNGEIISPLQHHLLSNRIVYVETDRDAAETVFNFLRGENYNAYLRPDKELIYRYIDLDNREIFVKNLVSESPLQMVDGIPMPTLEKLLVDILRDSDFYFLQGSESERIIDNAFSLYTVNRNKLLRYAERRKVKEELLTILDNLNLQ